jgi:drug/metabolite transporter (DMT)-like permease
VFPISNLGTVAVATIAGILFFKEQISKINWLGLVFAVVSIVLIILSSGVVNTNRA